MVVVEPVEEAAIKHAFVFAGGFCCSGVGKANETGVAPSPRREYPRRTSRASAAAPLQFVALLGTCWAYRRAWTPPPSGASVETEMLVTLMGDALEQGDDH